MEKVDTHLIQVVPLDVFRNDMMVKTVFRHDTEVSVGHISQSLDARGKLRLFSVSKVGGNRVTIDFTYPLAGKTLYYYVVVREIQSSDRQEEI